MVKVLRSLSRHIHPQLPLSHRESDKLLSALTGSFRQHLEAAHPSNPSDPLERAIDSGRDATSTPHTLSDSSAVSADRHLASILTSPLFSHKPVRRTRNVVERDSRDVAGDHPRPPITLLDASIAEGSMTFGSASDLLHSIRADVKKLEKSKRIEAVQELSPGRKVFAWLANDKLYHPESYASHVTFLGHLCYFLVLEGRESAVWDWLKLDLALPDAHSTASHAPRSSSTSPYSWKNTLLEALVAAKLYATGRIGPAVDTLQAANTLKADAPEASHINALSLYPAHTFLCELLTLKTRKISPQNAQRLEDYIRLIQAMHETGAEFRLQVDAAWLRLLHPGKPDALQAYNLLREHYALSATERASRALPSISHPAKSVTDDKWPLFLQHTAVTLEQTGHAREAEWVHQKALAIYGPRYAGMSKVKQGSRANHEAATDSENNAAFAYTSFA